MHYEFDIFASTTLVPTVDTKSDGQNRKSEVALEIQVAYHAINLRNAQIYLRLSSHDRDHIFENNHLSTFKVLSTCSTWVVEYDLANIQIHPRLPQADKERPYMQKHKRLATGRIDYVR